MLLKKLSQAHFYRLDEQGLYGQMIPDVASEKLRHYIQQSDSNGLASAALTVSLTWWAFSIYHHDKSLQELKPFIQNIYLWRRLADAY